MGLQRAVRRNKEGTSAILFQYGLDENWRANSMEWSCLRVVKIANSQSQKEQYNFMAELRGWDHQLKYGINLFEKFFLMDRSGFYHPYIFKTHICIPGEARDDSWSISGDFIYQHHFSTMSQTLHAKKRIISYSTEIHWRHQSHQYNLGCIAGAPTR